jgi:hypothetical protein
MRAFYNGVSLLPSWYWADHDASTRVSGSACTSSGTQQVKVEYYENGGSASARFNWSCQCVEYVKSRFGLTGGTGGNGAAAQMGPYLLNNGFRSQTNPAVGAIMVIQPYAVAGAKGAGHVAVVGSYSDGGSVWNVSMQSTNWNDGNNIYQSYSCNNFGTATVSAPKDGSKVLYYVR